MYLRVKYRLKSGGFCVRFGAAEIPVFLAPVSAFVTEERVEDKAVICL